MNDQYFGSHELHARKEVAQPSSDRRFGYVFGGFSALLAALSLYNGRHAMALLACAGVMFALVAFLHPGLLAPLNRLWTRLGLFLFAVVSPVMLVIVFYGCITPIGWLMRLAGKGPVAASLRA